MKSLTTAMMLMAVAALSACGHGSRARVAAEESETTVTAWQFSGDSAYNYVSDQLAFGPRVPGTTQHQKCAHWLIETLQGRGADTVLVIKGDGIFNIYARFEADSAVIAERGGTYNRDSVATVLMLAHYDTRPWADADPDPANRQTPIMGANDGGSGVGVLLELARQLSIQRAGVNVDILLTDAEDSGTTAAGDTSWCKGAQFFFHSHPYRSDRLPKAAILLDMVGGPDARFHREYFSDMGMTRALNDEVWSLARQLGLGHRFPNEVGIPVTDDHLPLQQAGIPAIDIIENKNADTGSFPPSWHTLADDMSAVSAATLGDVGTLVTTYIYRQK